MEEAIKTIHLSKFYGETRAVDDLNLSVSRGEIFGFLGLNGSGKTTTIRTLLGLVKPSQGEAFLLGKKVVAGMTDIWRDVGYLVETPYSYPELTVEENLSVLLKLRGIKDHSRVKWIMQMLQLEKSAVKKAKHLSLGNAQRLGIAKALIHKPKIVLLDEPTNGLDPAGIVEVLELLKDLAENSGVTILISSHRLAEISRIATSIGIIHGGRLVTTIDTKGLESRLRKVLLVDGRHKSAMQSILANAGYEVKQKRINERSVLALEDERAVLVPEEIAAFLVHEGHPPTLLKVEREDLEAFFLRTIHEKGVYRDHGHELH